MINSTYDEVVWPMARRSGKFLGRSWPKQSTGTKNGIRFLMLRARRSTAGSPEEW